LFTACLVWLYVHFAPQSTWFPEETPDILYTTSENGWTDNSHGYHWLQRIFIPETQPQRNEWRLLVLDGHGIHTAIDLSFLPAHTSHVLQPLDLGVFAPLKSRYVRQIAALASLDDASQIKKQRYLTCYKMARLDTFTPRLLRTEWKAAGLYPFNSSKGLNLSQIQASEPRAITPTQQHTTTTFFTTPKSSRQVH
jgi:hypothetical protein